MILAHPEVVPAVGKERHFFERYLQREFGEDDTLAYHELFPKPPGRVIGEWTPGYMHDLLTPALLRRAAPEARILVLLRDPWERFVSGLAHDARTLKRELRRRQGDYLHSLVLHDALQRSLYATQVEHLLKSFNPSQVLVLQYERCRDSTEAELENTYEFLGLRPTYRPASERRQAKHTSSQAGIPVHLERAARELIGADALRLKETVPELELDLWPSSR